MRHAQAGFEYHGPGIPRSSFYDSPFGRMFSKIEPWEPDSDIESEVRAAFETFAQANMNDDAPPGPDPAGDNHRIPAGYTYFGQFVDHDITFDPTTSLMRHNDPNKHRNFRTPRLDLDSVYGAGPDASPHLYDPGDDRFGYFVIGHGERSHELDLPRINDKTAAIGDPRNDENIIVSQIQLAFLLFHNKVLEALAGAGTRPTGSQFREAQRIVRWTYQYIVWNDFVKRLTSNSVWSNAIREFDLGKLGARRLYYKWKQSPYIPVEFSVAAYRLGHAMVRNEYLVNITLGFQDGVSDKPIFSMDGSADLRGGRQLPANHTIQWDWFFDFAPVDNDSRGRFPQLARRFNPKLGKGVQAIPTGPNETTHLAVLNLLRGWRMGLPAGSAVGDYMSVDNRMKPNSNIDDCLWVYILNEAALAGTAPGGEEGLRLGSVGGRIVAEVFAGLLLGDPSSYAAIHPDWTPAKDITRLFGDGPIQGDANWTVADIIKCAGLPIDAGDISTLHAMVDLTSTDQPQDA